MARPPLLRSVAARPRLKRLPRKRDLVRISSSQLTISLLTSVGNTQDEPVAEVKEEDSEVELKVEVKVDDDAAQEEI